MRESSLNKTNDPTVLSNLIASDKKAVNIVSRGAGVQRLFVLLNLPLDKRSHLLNLGKNFVVAAGQMLHDPGKDVVHLFGREAHSTMQFCLSWDNVGMCQYVG